MANLPDQIKLSVLNLLKMNVVPGRRTIVHVEEVKAPIIASRTENSILAGMLEIPRNELEAFAALELLYDIRDDIMQIRTYALKRV